MLKRIEKAGRTCYKSENKSNHASAVKFVKMILKRGHESVIEHEKITVRVICDRGVCYSADTKVLTNNGWKYFYEVNSNDLIYTKNNKDELILTKNFKLIKEFYTGDLINFKTTQIDLLVTPEHKMWVQDIHTRKKEWKFIRAIEMFNKAYKFSKGCNFWKKKSKKEIKIENRLINRGFYKKIFKGDIYNRKDFYKFLGVWITDGSLTHRKNNNGGSIVISQKKEKGKKEIEKILKILRINYRIKKNEYIINNLPLYYFLKENFLKNDDYKKTYYISLPFWIKNESKECLESLLEGIKLGDGTNHSKSKGFYIYTASEKFAEDIVEIALKIGKTANISYLDVRNRPNHFIQGKVKTYRVSIINTINHYFRKNEKSYKIEGNCDDVYCVEMPKYHKLYVMRNGKPVWCGNSHELVRHRLGSYSQESTRYCNYAGKDMEFIIPCFWNSPSPAKNDELYNLWDCHMQQCEKIYNLMIMYGATPQEARSVLPNSLKTEIVITYNLREWRHFLKLRTHKTAHPQMREVACRILSEFKKRLPEVFEDIEVENGSWRP
jgi:thymidylate synthase ThyX